MKANSNIDLAKLQNEIKFLRKEQEIEVALEKIRSRTMAMHNSDELKDIVAIVFEKLQELHFGLDGAVILGIPVPGTKETDYWLADVDKAYPSFFRLPYYDAPSIKDMWDARESGVEFVTKIYTYEEKNKWFKYAFEYTDLKILPDERKNWILEQKFLTQAFAISKNFIIGIHVHFEKVLSEYEIDIIKRFSKVFDQSYTRFLDLQKAEAQAREAQIEASLERVRARAMAMHKSEELSEAATLLYQQLRDLGIDQFMECGYVVIDEKNNIQHGWLTDFEGATMDKFMLPLNGEPAFDQRYESWKRQDPAFKQELGGKKLKSSIEFAMPHLGSEEVKNLVLTQFPDPTIFYCFNFPSGYLHLITETPLSGEHESLLVRFTRVFELTYKRFLDLQKAEAQTREAQIEAALERVRAATMAMHKSDELLNVITVVSEQLQLLDFKFDNVSFAINNQQNDYNFWLSSAGQPFPYYIHVPYIDNPMFERVREVQKNGVKFYSDTLTKEENKQWIQHLLDHNDVEFLSEETRIFLLNSGFARSIAIMPNIMLIIGNYASNPYSEKENDIIKRFAQVFEQSYTRFLDLQRAETQAREAQIEASLERIRSRSMAMQQSGELNIILARVFEELTSLELELERCVIWIYYPEDKSVRWWAANPEAESGAESFLITHQDHPVYLEYWKAWEERRTKYLYILEGDNMVSWCDVLFYETELGRLSQEVQVAMRQPDKVYLYNTFNDFGVLFLACLNPLSDDKFSILERFGKVFDQSYTRFNDIKQAESREKEAIKQSSLDRVRAEIASMRTTQDLERITPLIWRELTTLGVPFIRCGVFIMNEIKHVIQAYLSAPEGHSLGVFDLPYDSKELAANALKNWRKNKIYKDHWNKVQFIEFMQNLVQSGQIENPESFQGASAPPESLYLNFLPFKQGMLYVGNTEAFSEDELQLVQALANAFSIAYARYEDFNELENAKYKVEVTLNELKSTQSQLIQSEKMASLGELTAGIAHEIQNPLNFVNNFSEVSRELAEELKEEAQKLNIDTNIISELAADIADNQNKINHHGHRASEIVKSMLEHSRTSNGQKELIDINTLVDEYLRLAYHGLRAKDRSFKAEFTSDLDQSLPKINVIPQDIGRVLLNLINNAFYAVNTKSKERTKDYKPEVVLSTRKHNEKIVIKIKDNGNGIPEKIKDKIFQPFFTTKPTGQGTGLGLSMSYDIIKAHGGELYVESVKGKVTDFTISLPVNL